MSTNVTIILPDSTETLSVPAVGVSSDYNPQADWEALTSALANIIAARQANVIDDQLRNTAILLFQLANDTQDTIDLTDPVNAKYLEAAATISDSVVEARAADVIAQVEAVQAESVQNPKGPGPALSEA